MEKCFVSWVLSQTRCHIWRKCEGYREDFNDLQQRQEQQRHLTQSPLINQSPLLHILTES